MDIHEKKNYTFVKFVLDQNVSPTSSFSTSSTLRVKYQHDNVFVPLVAWRWPNRKKLKIKKRKQENYIATHRTQPNQFLYVVILVTKLFHRVDRHGFWVSLLNRLLLLATGWSSIRLYPDNLTELSTEDANMQSGFQFGSSASVQSCL